MRLGLISRRCNKNWRNYLLMRKNAKLLLRLASKGLLKSELTTTWRHRYCLTGLLGAPGKETKASIPALNYQKTAVSTML